jgi:hypothetical protein
MYTSEGIRISVQAAVVPWDRVQRVRIGGRRATRHVMWVTDEKLRGHGVLPAPGVGGVRRHDVGRVLVADLFEDGQWIDAFALPGQKILSMRPGEDEMPTASLKCSRCGAWLSK